MAGMYSFEIDRADLKQLIGHLVIEPVYRKPCQAMMANIARVAEGYARRGAPRGKTGQLQAHISSKVTSGKIPSAVVKTDAVNPRGGRRGRPYPYPRLLEFSPKHHHKDWLKNSIEAARGAIGAQVTAAARIIESNWGR